MPKKKRVLVGMSGGVDSSVTAALLKKRGYDVIGITLQLLPKEKEMTSACCNLGAVDDARRVARKIGISHYVVNSRSVFQERVIDHFVDQYLNGQTPNPCVECNRSIKFDELADKMAELDADYMATGHYCMRTYSPHKKVYNLKQAKDPSKDQSYFLYMMSSDQLAKTLFPLGGYYKSEIRDMARDLGLVNADKPDSQEICFVTGKSYKEFIDEYLGDKKVESGDILDLEGRVLGTHEGIYKYTIGQRRGLNISSSEPLFVLKINAKDNTIVVGPKDVLKRTDLKLHTFTLVNPDEAIIGKTFDIKMRYQMSLVKAKVISHDGSDAIVQMRSPQSFVASGQSCVLYDKARVVGGGIIV